MKALAVRRECKIDKRGTFIDITDAGRELQKKMWNSYSAAIERHIGSKLSDSDAVTLSGLLDRLGCCEAALQALKDTPPKKPRLRDDFFFISSRYGCVHPFLFPATRALRFPPDLIWRVTRST